MCQAGHTIFNEGCRPCKDLRTEWYQYLNAQGFEDIERADGLLKINAQAQKNIQAFNHPGLFEARFSYYQWAQSKVNAPTFKSHTDKLIWQFHAEGYSRDQISPRIGLEASWISRKIKTIENYLKYAVGSVSMAIA